MAISNLYDMMRQKAKSMGHTAANAPDTVWEKIVDKKDQLFTLRKAKLYVEDYMMGNVEPAEFARIMAQDDSLRYAISDLCRMRLEPVELDVQRNNSYIDVVAGAKTFWTEIRVPLPSERDAARDIRNINFGIEAGKAVADEQPVKEIPKKLTLRERLNRIKEGVAGKAIEMFTPIAEGKKEDTKEQMKPIDESWLETKEGREYKDVYTKKAAQQIETMTANIEAVKGEPKEAESENQSANESTKLQSGYSEEELNCPLNDQMQSLFDQIAQHMNENKTNQSSHADEQVDAVITTSGQEQIRRSTRFNRIYGTFENKNVSFKDNWSGHNFTNEEAAKLLKGEDISFTYTDRKGNEKTAVGKLEWQTYEGKSYLGFKADYDKTNSADKPAEDSSLFNAADEKLMNQYTEEEHNEDEDDYYDDDEYIELSAADCANLFDDGMQM